MKLMFGLHMQALSSCVADWSLINASVVEDVKASVENISKKANFHPTLTHSSAPDLFRGSAPSAPNKVSNTSSSLEVLPSSFQREAVIEYVFLNFGDFNPC